MGSSGGGGGGDSTQTIRYAPYIEEKHKDFLNTVQTKRNAIIDDSPFANHTSIIVDDAFFGSSYAITSFPTMYDMFGKFLAGLDIDVLHSQIFQDTVNAPEINDLVAAESSQLNDDLAEGYTRIKLGHRDINSVVSTTFEVDKAILERQKLKSVAQFRAGLKYRMIPIAVERWKTHLGWNESVIRMYAEIMKLYYSAKMDIDDFNATMSAKDKLWPFTVLDHERAALGALQGARSSSGVAGKASTGAKAISGALGGAAMGAMIAGASNGAIAGPVGIAVGATLGLASAFF